MIALFLILVVWLLVAAAFALKCYERARLRRMAQRLEVATQAPPEAATALLRDAGASRPGLGIPLREWPLGRGLETLIRQAGADTTPEQVLGSMLMFAAVGLFGGMLVPLDAPAPPRGLAAAVLCGSLPLVALRRKRAKRLARMEEQLPEALDFLARSMRAGHAFTISLEMLGEELGPPLGLEFRTAFNEHNLGAPLDLALRNMTERVPSLDLRFFVSAVSLQRQTGGNLSEILSRLAYVIRERFRLRGQVKAASAHGRMTAGILTLLPLVTMGALLAIAPGYMQSMFKDPDGKNILIGAAVAQVIGNLIMRKIIRIKV